MTGLFTRNRLIGLILAAVIYFTDQWLKDYITWTLKLPEKGTIDLLPFFDLTWVENYGVSLGMLTAQSMEMRWGLVALTSVIALVVFVWILREKAFGDILGLSLVLGGAAGNIDDRMNFGFVVDYADFHIGTFRPFLVFNLADAAITIGVLIILARSFLIREKADQKSDAGAPVTEN
ncbi:MAG: signal peptidase [Pseudomonadota bacterium]